MIWCSTVGRLAFCQASQLSLRCSRTFRADANDKTNSACRYIQVAHRQLLHAPMHSDSPCLSCLALYRDYSVPRPRIYMGEIYGLPSKVMCAIRKESNLSVCNEAVAPLLVDCQNGWCQCWRVERAIPLPRSATCIFLNIDGMILLTPRT